MRIRTDSRMGLLSAAALVAVVALSATALTACGSGGGGSDGSSSSPATPKTIEITPVAQTGTTVEAAVGDTIVVSLEANATTGYTWKFTAGDTFEVVSSEYVPDPNPDELAGKGGTQVVTLKVTKTGASDLTGTYQQQWNSPSPGAKPDFSMTVEGK